MGKGQNYHYVKIYFHLGLSAFKYLALPCFFVKDILF